MNSCFQEVKMNSVFAPACQLPAPQPEGQLSRDCTSTHTDMQMSVRDRVRREASRSTVLKPGLGG